MGPASHRADIEEALAAGIELGFETGLQRAFERGVERGTAWGFELGVERGRRMVLGVLAERLIQRRFPGALPGLADALARCSADDLEAIAEATILVSSPEQLAAAIEARLESPSD